MQHLFRLGSSLHAQRKEEEVRGQRSINLSVVSGSGMHTNTHTHTDPHPLLYRVKGVRKNLTEKAHGCVY